MKYGRLFLFLVLGLVLDSVVSVLLKEKGILLGGFLPVLKVAISYSFAYFVVYYLPQRLQEGKQDARYMREIERKKGMTPLMVAAADGDVETVNRTLASDADVNTRDAGGGTALMFATLNHHTEIVRLLLEAGANPRLSTHKGLTALDIAKNKDFADLQTLLDSGAKED